MGSSNMDDFPEPKTGLLRRSKKVAIVFRPSAEYAFETAKWAAKWLEDKGYTTYTAGICNKAIPGTKKISATSEDIKKLALVLVLGGDGTYLRAARWLNGVQVPILGVNMGSLGFLTETRRIDLESNLDKTLKGEMQLRPRSMISVTIKEKGKKPRTTEALNDVVIERGAQPQLMHISLTSEKKHVATVKADGLVIASPTGSTAYNLAAGGPILHPEVRAFVVTPICPHSLTSRPVILPEDRTFSFSIRNRTGKAHLVVDGQSMGFLHESDEVVIKRSKKIHWVVRSAEHNYFSLLTDKLKFGQRD
jgi:NAD+ kinase